MRPLLFAVLALTFGGGDNDDSSTYGDSYYYGGYEFACDSTTCVTGS